LGGIGGQVSNAPRIDQLKFSDVDPCESEFSDVDPCELAGRFVKMLWLAHFFLPFTR
jgi:hypothetical protein